MTGETAGRDHSAAALYVNTHVHKKTDYSAFAREQYTGCTILWWKVIITVNVF